MKDLPTDEICHLYTNKRLSSTKIAKKYGCCKATILKRLRKANVKMRDAGLPRLKISDEELKRLYIEERLSTWKLGKLIGCGRSTVHRKLRKLEVIKDIATSHIKYSRKPFSGDATEKAYLTGFAVGDLRVRKVGKRSKTIKIDCGSTKKEQIDLIKDLFSGYGRVWISKPKNGRIQIEAFVGDSFEFLLNCRNKLGWIFGGKGVVPFLAGFTDAEGSIFITNNKVIYSLGNYDHELLLAIKKRLQSYGIESHIYYSRKRHVIDGYKQKRHYWQLRVHKKRELLKLFNMLGPHIRHRKRKIDMQRAINHISRR